MSQIGDTFRVTWTGEYLTSQVIQVFHYRLVSGSNLTTAAVTLTDLMESVVWAAVKKLLNVEYTLQTIYAVNWPNPDDFDIRAVGETGDNSTAGAAALPSWMTVAFRYNRKSAAGRHGYKRFAGILDQQVQGNAWTGNAADTDDVEAALVALLEEGGGSENVYSPLIANRGFPLGTNPTGYVPEVCELNGVSTQLSRKP